MAKRKRRFFRPGAKGGEFTVRRRKETKDGSIVSLPAITIGSSGYATEDPEILKVLDNHPFKGHRLGFYEVSSLAKEKVIANGAADKEEEIIPDSSRGGAEAQSGDDADKVDLKADNKFDALPEDTKFPYHYGGGHYFLSDGSKFQGKKNEAEAAEADLHEQEPSDGKEDEGTKTKVVEDVTNINQLKDYLIDEGVDGQSLTTPDKIIAAAEALSPPTGFPNLKTGG